MLQASPASTSALSSGTPQRQLQGLVARRTATAEPKNAAQYFGNVADVVRVNQDLTNLRYVPAIPCPTANALTHSNTILAGRTT
jgi:hypothetical protein